MESVKSGKEYAVKVTNNSYKNLMLQLQSTKCSDVYNALITIRKKYVRNLTEMEKLEEYSVIKVILSYLEHPKHCNFSLSIIADACIHESLIFEVIKNDGVKSLIRIMNSLVNDEILNRACRALGNIAKTEIGYNTVHKFKPVSKVVQFLCDTKDVNCQQTAIRTLSILGKCSKGREEIIRENGVISIVRLLDLSDPKLLLCSIKALAVLTENCSYSSAIQFLELESLQIFVQLCSHSDKGVKENALVTLKNLCEQEFLRYRLIRAGSVNVFKSIVIRGTSPARSRLATLGLCSCLDLIYLWESNGTPRLIGLAAVLMILESIDFCDIHLQIITSLQPLCYEIVNAGHLLNMKIITILISILKRFIKENKMDHVLSKFVRKTFVVLGFQKPGKISTGLENFEHDLNSADANNILKNEALHHHTVSDNGSNNLSNSCESENAYISSDKSLDVSSFNSLLPTTGCAVGCSNNCNELALGSSSLNSPRSSTSKNTGQVCKNINEASTSSMGTSNVINETSERRVETEINPNHVPENVPKASTSGMVVDTMNMPAKKHKAEELGDDLDSESHVNSGTSRKRAKIDLLVLNSNINAKKNSQNDKSQNEMPRNSWIDYHIVNLLLQLSYVENKNNSELAGKNCFITLLDYLCVIDNANPKVEKLLLNLMRNRLNFEKLILSGFITEVEERMLKLHALEECRRCLAIEKFRERLLKHAIEEVQSDFGIGTLCHMLFTCSQPDRIHVIYAAAKLITKKIGIMEFFKRANGLSALFVLLRDSRDHYRRKSAISLCRLYQNLKKASNILSKCCFNNTCEFNPTFKCFFRESTSDVTFFLDSGAQVAASRETICENSAYFSALLEGGFCENRKDKITLHEVSSEALSTIFHFLHGCGYVDCCPYIQMIPYDVLLEMLAESDRLLLPHVKLFIEDRLCHSLSSDTVAAIYLRAKMCNSQKLSFRALDFLLSGDDILYGCLDELLQNEINWEFLDDIRVLINHMFV